MTYFEDYNKIIDKEMWKGSCRWNKHKTIMTLFKLEPVYFGQLMYWDMLLMQSLIWQYKYDNEFTGFRLKITLVPKPRLSKLKIRLFIENLLYQHPVWPTWP